jgi:hypothetical protein
MPPHLTGSGWHSDHDKQTIFVQPKRNAKASKTTLFIAEGVPR